MSIYPNNERPTVSRATLTMTDRGMNCGRQELHMCRVKDLEMLAHLWPWMKGRIEVLRQKNPPRTHWIHEHVRAEITKGLLNQTALECFVAHKDGEEADTLHGMLVVHPLVDPWNALPLTWFVWLATIEPGVMLQLLPEFERMARERGYLRWEWGTNRKGWARRAELFGATVVEYRLCKELE